MEDPRILILNGLVGTPGVIRTPDPLLRRQVLYPAELRAQRQVPTWRRKDTNGLQIISVKPSPFSQVSHDARALSTEPRLAKRPS
jgi:hypothetical protein